MRVALQNIHLLPNIFDLGIHDYMLELLRRRHISVLFFSDYDGMRLARIFCRSARSKAPYSKFAGIKWGEFDFAFSGRELRRKADVLLNLNMMYMPKLENEFSSGVIQFNGLKIFHVGDYFWNHPGSELNRLLERAGVDHLFGYAMHDRHCRYFQQQFPKYSNRVWGIPFGFAPRFRPINPFTQRLNKVVALGSVNPLRPLQYPVHNYRETADFFPDECWFHRFRRQLVLNKPRLSIVMDSMLPEFPLIKDFKYDLVGKFNAYRMFTTCESIFQFPSAKVFEGPACGSILVCADHACNKEYGFEDGQNCIMYKMYSVDDFQEKVQWRQNNACTLSAIAERGCRWVSENFSHEKVAQLIKDTIKYIWNHTGKLNATTPESILMSNKLSCGRERI